MDELLGVNGVFKTVIVCQNNFWTIASIRIWRNKLPFDAMMQKRQISVHHLLNKLKHGCDVLSLCKGLSPQFHQVVVILVGVGVGVAGLCVAIRKGYFGWSDIPGASGQKGSSEFIYYVAGLQNLGSNCFLNVIMQVSFI